MDKYFYFNVCICSWLLNAYLSFLICLTWLNGFDELPVCSLSEGLTEKDWYFKLKLFLLEHIFAMSLVQEKNVIQTHHFSAVQFYYELQW